MHSYAFTTRKTHFVSTKSVSLKWNNSLCCKGIVREAWSDYYLYYFVVYSIFLVKFPMNNFLSAEHLVEMAMERSVCVSGTRIVFWGTSFKSLEAIYCLWEGEQLDCCWREIIGLEIHVHSPIKKYKIFNPINNHRIYIYQSWRGLFTNPYCILLVCLLYKQLENP